MVLLKNALPCALLLCLTWSVSCKHTEKPAEHTATGRDTVAGTIPGERKTLQSSNPNPENGVPPSPRKQEGVVLTSEAPQGSGLNYTVQPPSGWTVYDTVVQQLEIRLLIPPQSLAADRPAVNILVASMNGRDVDNFENANIEDLKRKSKDVVLMRKGEIRVSGLSARWFTYDKQQNGTAREMINYMIPVQGFAYIFTCGVNNGAMNNYRPIFDEIVRSFRK